MNAVSIALGIALILSLIVNYCLVSVNEKSGKRNEELFEENESLKNDIDRAYGFARQAERELKVARDLLDAQIAQKREAEE